MRWRSVWENSSVPVLLLFSALTVALCASLGVAAILLLNQPKPQYFAATPDLRLAPMIPLDQPLLTQEGLLTWASNAITGAMSLNFLEWGKNWKASDRTSMTRPTSPFSLLSKVPALWT